MSVERELTNGTPPTLSLTIVDSGRDAMLIWLELGTRTIVPCVQGGRGGGGQAAAQLVFGCTRCARLLGRRTETNSFKTPPLTIIKTYSLQTVHVHALNKRGPNTAISNIVLNVLFASSAFSQ